MLINDDGGFDYIDGHFLYICGCRNPKGSHYKNGDSFFEDRSAGSTLKYTFYMNNILLAGELREREDSKESPLIIVCNNCNSELELTNQKYKNLKAEIKKINFSISEQCKI